MHRLTVTPGANGFHCILGVDENPSLAEFSEISAAEFFDDVVLGVDGEI
jgi:hypothetical protein